MDIILEKVLDKKYCLTCSLPINHVTCASGLADFAKHVALYDFPISGDVS